MNILLFVLGWGVPPPAAVEVHHLPWLRSPSPIMADDHNKEDAP